jgi:hypothetical protein
MIKGYHDINGLCILRNDQGWLDCRSAEIAIDVSQMSDSALKKVAHTDYFDRLPLAHLELERRANLDR